MKLYMCRAVPLPIIRSFSTVHSAMVYVIQVCRQFSSRTWSFLKAVIKPVWHIPLLSVQWINSWLWTEELPDTCRVSWQNKFGQLVRLLVLLKRNLLRCSTVTCHDARSHDPKTLNYDRFLIIDIFLLPLIHNTTVISNYIAKFRVYTAVLLHKAVFWLVTLGQVPNILRGAALPRESSSPKRRQ